MSMAVTYYCLGDSDQKTFVRVWYRQKKYFHLMVEPFNMKIVDLESGPYFTTREMPVCIHYWFSSFGDV